MTPDKGLDRSMTERLNHSQFDLQQPAASPADDRTFRKLILALVAAGIVAAGIHIGLFFQTQAWQTLLVAGALVASGCLVWVGWRRYRRQSREGAGVWVLAGVALALATSELVWSGATLHITLGGLALMLLAGRLLAPHSLRLQLTAAILLEACLLALHYLSPIPRLSLSQAGWLWLYIPLLVSLLIIGLLGQWLAAVQAVSIRNRLLAAFLLALAIPIAIMASVANILGTRNIQQQVTNQLESVATIKEAEVNAWALQLQDNLNNVFLQEDYGLMVVFLKQHLAHPETSYGTIQTRLDGELIDYQERTGLYDELFVMDREGWVLLSTNPGNIAKNFSRRLYFEKGATELYINPPYFFEPFDKYIVTVSQPVKDEAGVVVGVVAAHAPIEALNRLMIERTGLGETGETYLVGPDRTILTALRGSLTGTYSHSEAIDKAIAGLQDGAGLYNNGNGIPVIGVYHWLPDLQMALLAEQSQAEAFRGNTLVSIINSGVALLSFAAAIVVALLLTRSFTRPLSEMAGTAALIASGNLELTVKASRQDEVGKLAQAFNSMTAQVRALVTQLEGRVAERTRDLERRTGQIQAAAEVARDITTTTSLEVLLNQSVNLIRERFGFYHAGVFLVDEQGEFAVLRAATGEAGRMMLEREHRLKVGEVGIVGYVCGSAKPRIALDVGDDAAHFKNPLLPHTRSEIGLPLRAGSQVIGALDVQSTEEAAFTEEDITVLQIMADQLAVAIQNARLIGQLNETLEEMQQAYGQFTQDAWRSYAQATRRPLGYRYGRVDVQPMAEARPEAKDAMRQGETIIIHAGQENGGSGFTGTSSLAVPIRLRGSVIGVLNLRLSSQIVSPATVKLVEETVSRLALVLENARLLEEAQQRAAREHLIGQITDQMQRANDMDTLIKRTVQQLQQALDVSYAVVHFGVEEQH